MSTSAIRFAGDVYLPSAPLRLVERAERITRLGWTLRVQREDRIRCVWDNHGESLRVIESLELHPATSLVEHLVPWHHVSLSHRSRRLPTWEEMSAIKRAFLGDDCEAYIVHPPRERYVNDSPVLHWWHCAALPFGVLPDFRVSDSTGRVSL